MLLEQEVEREYPVNKICIKFCEGKEKNVMRGEGGDQIKIGSARESICKEITFKLKPGARLEVSEVEHRRQF